MIGYDARWGVKRVDARAAHQAGPLTSVVSNVKIRLNDLSRTEKLGETSMNVVSGIAGSYTLDRSASGERIPSGTTWIATFTATIGGSTRTWRQAISRP
jgi:hypothetical protein